MIPCPYEAVLPLPLTTVTYMVVRKPTTANHPSAVAQATPATPHRGTRLWDAITRTVMLQVVPMNGITTLPSVSYTHLTLPTILRV